MSRRRTEPKEGTLKELLTIVFEEHPIVKEKWIVEALSWPFQPSDRQVLSCLCRVFEDMDKYNCMLPYKVSTHLKLKSILEHNKLPYNHKPRKDHGPIRYIKSEMPLVQ